VSATVVFRVENLSQKIKTKAKLPRVPYAEVKRNMMHHKDDSFQLRDDSFQVACSLFGCDGACCAVAAAECE
jgi:hypothetical protein